MEIYNNSFTVTFTNAAAANKAKQIADESFRALHYNGYSEQPAILAANSLIIKDDVTLTFEELCFDSAALMDASRKVIKAIAFAMSEESFEFSVCGCDTNFRLLEGTMNKKTTALTTEQYKEIITTMKEGGVGFRPNERIATALVLEGNLGLRISDILRLRPCDIVNDGGRYRMEIVEQKTGKSRVFTVPLVIQQYVENYCLRNGIQRNDRIFPITERAVQKQLAIVCDYLDFQGISTHSFRKWYATEIYKANGYDIALVQRLLQHSSAAVTQRYIGIEPQRIERAIEGHAKLI